MTLTLLAAASGGPAVTMQSAALAKYIGSSYIDTMLLSMSRQDASRRRDQRADRTSAAGAALYGLVSGAVRRIPRQLSLTSASTLATLERTGPSPNH